MPFRMAYKVYWSEYILCVFCTITIVNKPTDPIFYGFAFVVFFFYFFYTFTRAAVTPIALP